MSSTFQWDWPQAEAGASMTVQVTQGVRTARDLRSLLMDAAYSLKADDEQTALCLLFKSGFSSRGLRQELTQFQSVVKKDLGRRIQVHALKSPADLRLALPPGMDAPVVEALQARVAQALAGKPKTSTQEAVVGQLLHRWINQLPAVTVAELTALSGASIPTVYAALTTLKGSSLQRNEERGLSLAGFSVSAWQQWLSKSSQGPVAKFVDRSGAPRSPQKLARQLAKLGRSDVAIGGVLGAMHHFPGLDITAAPYLDLVVHGTPHTDLSFVEQLDPGLERDDSKDAPGHVIVHYVNRPHSLFKTKEGVVWADVLDCLVNLWDAQLLHQVEDLIRNIAPGGLRESSGR